ncbi:hypothetical protein HPP92_019725 [Vanilla planifolia]|uniref:J domain-containing protein n=1 Tax=Vanilla planifolia TaxID=51239 RepID=A0A835Q0S8_VANPL|nr:hypothetical protein HPP92_020159 [Vanilla planifolia]KAG0465561.1 hypothetical protein HPP92_019725 [Vanilla planifolia]
MGKDRDAKRRRTSVTSSSPSTSSSSSSSSSDSENAEEKRRRRRHRNKRSRHREKDMHRTRDEEARRSSRKKKRKRRKRSPSDSGDDSSFSGGDFLDREEMGPEDVIRLILENFPDVAHDVSQLLQLIDSGQGVDIKQVSDKGLVRLLKKLFISLNLKRDEKGIFFLPTTRIHTLEVIGSTFYAHIKPREDDSIDTVSPKRHTHLDLSPKSSENQYIHDPKTLEQGEKGSMVHSKRIIGPEMPSRELLEAAAELTRAEAELRDVDLEVDNDLFIGPPPPAMVAEAESANEAERFEEVSRIVMAEVSKPYDVLGVTWRASFDSIKKRYWKLSLMVHPDKCSHPQAHQAFVILNQAFKDLQDPEKKNSIDEKIKIKEDQEAFKAELQALREAAQWRRLQGISMEGDDELLAFNEEEPKAKRDEWMTELPPERKPGMPVQSTTFSRFGKEGRGDTSMWTDTPLDKSRKAKQNYLEAYDKAREIADVEDRRKSRSSEADLVDKYNSTKRSKSLVQKHQEERGKQQKRKSKEPVKGEWEGSHPWKPWDREKDLAANRQRVNLDADNMARGLTSRFSSASSDHRHFL